MKIGNLELTRENLAQMIDYSVLGLMQQSHNFRSLPGSKEYNFKAFTRAHLGPRVAEELEGTGIETGYVLSFPFGANPTKSR